VSEGPAAAAGPPARSDQVRTLSMAAKHLGCTSQTAAASTGSSLAHTYTRMHSATLYSETSLIRTRITRTVYVDELF